MDIGDSGEFTRRLVTLGELFEVTLSPVKQAMYFDALRDVPFEAVAVALRAAARGCTFMPKPAELRKLALGDDDDTAERAWQLLRTAFRRAGAYRSIAGEAALVETIAAMFGSWPAACQCEVSPEMWASKRKEFGRVYRLMRDRALDGHRYLPGIVEQQNAARLEWRRFAELAVLDGADVRLLNGDEAETYRGQLAAVAGSVFQPLAASAPRALPAAWSEPA